MRVTTFLSWILTTLMASSTAAQENITAIDNITQPIETTTEYVLPIDLSSIFSIKFDLKEESVNQVAAQVVYNGTEANITVNDLVELTEAESLNLTVVNEVLDKLDLSSPDLFDFNSLESAFTELNVSALAVYRRMLEEFIPQPRENVPRLLDTFDINQSTFNDVILYGNDTDLFNILKSANFSEENVQKAFDIIGKTPSNLYDFLKPIIFPNIRVYPIERLLNIVKSNGLTPKHFEDVLDIFELSRARYNAIPSFRNALTDYVNQINNVELYGTLVNVSEIATVNFVYNRYEHLHRVANAYVESVVTPRTSYKVTYINAYTDDCLYGPVIVKFEGSSAGKAVAIAQDYGEHHIHGCHYVVATGGPLIKEKLDHVDYKQYSLVAEVSNSTELKIGSPLICYDYLYGVAEDISKGRIGFRSFHCDGSVLDTTTIFADDASAATRVHYAINTITVMIIIQTFIMLV